MSKYINYNDSEKIDFKDIDNLITRIDLYNRGLDSKINFTDKDTIIIISIFTIWDNLKKGYKLKLKWLFRHNRQDKKYIGYVINEIKKLSTF